VIVAEVEQLAPCTDQQLWQGKDWQLRRLKEMRQRYGPGGEDYILNDRGVAMLDMAIVETLVSLRRLEGR